MSDERENPPGVTAAAWEPEPILGGRAAYALAVVSGALVAAAFAGIGWWWLSFVAWVPLILAVRGQSTRRAFGLGLTTGSVLVGIGFYWLTPMLQTFGGFPLPLCILFAALLSVYQGGRIAVLAWAHARAERRGWHPDLTFLGAFALSEVVYPLLFPWYFGASFHDHPIFMQTAELGGPILVSLVYVGTNLAIAALVRSRLFRTRLPRATVVAGFAATALAIGYGAVRMRAIDALIARSEPVKIGLIQANIELHQPRAGLRDSLHLTQTAKDQGAELVVWSEAAIPQKFDRKNHAAALRQALRRQLGVPGVVGGVLYERIPGAIPSEGPVARLYNSAFLIDGDGEVTSSYDKQFLMMFGEYIPFGDVFPIVYTWSPNSSAFTPGKSLEPLVLGNHRLTTMICYEDILPSFVNKLVRHGQPDLLVNLTNDRWFQNQRAGHGDERDTSEPIQHLALAKLRTIEHRMYLARVSNSGLSALVDANGRVVVQTESMRPAAAVGEARYMRVTTPYAILGDGPWWLVGALTVAAGFRNRKRSTVTSPAL